MLDKFAAEGISPIHIHQVVTEILAKSPVVGMPIDEVSDDLKDWASNFKVEVELWKITKRNIIIGSDSRSCLTA